MLIGDEPQSYPSYRDIALVLVERIDFSVGIHRVRELRRGLRLSDKNEGGQERNAARSGMASKKDLIRLSPLGIGSFSFCAFGCGCRWIYPDGFHDGKCLCRIQRRQLSVGHCQSNWA